MSGPTPWVTVWSGFFPFVCRCGGWPVATLEWFLEWIFTLLRRCQKGKRRDSPAEICSRGFGLSAVAVLRITLSANVMNLGSGATWDTRAEDERSISFSAESFMST